MGGSLNEFRFGTFVGRFPSDGAASMAVKGLMWAEHVAVVLILTDSIKGAIQPSQNAFYSAGRRG